MGYSMRLYTAFIKFEVHTLYVWKTREFRMEAADVVLNERDDAKRMSAMT
jgi:hypothetical protein